MSERCALDGCGKPVPPERAQKGGRYCSPRCKHDNANAAKRVGRLEAAPAPFTRRCRNKQCIERFVPVNDQHWYHEPACRMSEDPWSVEEILQEEGSLLPQAAPMEMAKRAFGQKNRALRENTRLRSLRDYLTFEIQSFHDEHPEFRYPRVERPLAEKAGKRKSEREIIVQLSDWQVGKWEQGFGVEQTRARVEDTKRAVAEVVQRQRDAGFAVNRIVLAFGGDMIEGCYIYRGQNVVGLDRTSNTHRVTQQIRTAAHWIADFVAWCAGLAAAVDVQTVGGNHGRTNGPNDYADPEDNFDVMAAWWAQDICRNLDNVSWNTHEDWWGGFESLGHYIVAFHGDQWNGPLERLRELLPKWVTSGLFAGRKPRIVLTHHRHERAVKDYSGITVLQNGTIDGGSRWYTLAYGGASRPLQNIIVMSARWEDEAVFPVRFGEPSV